MRGRYTATSFSELENLKGKDGDLFPFLVSIEGVLKAFPSLLYDPHSSYGSQASSSGLLGKDSRCLDVTTSVREGPPESEGAVTRRTEAPVLKNEQKKNTTFFRVCKCFRLS